MKQLETTDKEDFSKELGMCVEKRDSEYVCLWGTEKIHKGGNTEKGLLLLCIIPEDRLGIESQAIE